MTHPIPLVSEENLSAAAAAQLGQPVAHMTLLAEQPRIERIRTIAGHVELRREVRTQTVQVPVEIQQEVLIIEARPVTSTLTPLASGASANVPLSAVSSIEIDGRPLAAGERVEIELSHEVPQVSKQVVTAHDVNIYRRRVVHTETHTLTLGQEVLDVQAHPSGGVAAQALVR